MKYQVLFSLKYNENIFKPVSAAVISGALRVNKQFENILYIYRTSPSIIRGFLPPKLASEVPSVLYLALELFGEKNRYPRKPMTLPFFIK